MVFPGTGVDYDANLDEVLDIPFVGLGEQKSGKFIKQLLPDRALSFLQPHKRLAIPTWCAFCAIMGGWTIAGWGSAAR